MPVGLKLRLRLLMLILSLVWDCKPDDKDRPINWIELKTTAEINNDRDVVRYERKLLKFWIQSFLLGVPKIVVGFRTENGILQSLQELETRSVPGMVKRSGKNSWDGNICINFTAKFLQCGSYLISETKYFNLNFKGLSRRLLLMVSGEYVAGTDHQPSRSISIRNLVMVTLFPASF